jgi:hypothetical protein
MGRLRVLLIVALAVSPVTADLGHGLSWSKASGQKGGIYPSGRGAKTTGRSRCVCTLPVQRVSVWAKVLVEIRFHGAPPAGVR